VPPAARRFLPAASATFVATWALGGLYQAFGPTVAAEQLGTSNTLAAAVVLASLMAPSAVGAPLSGRLRPAGAQRIGMATFFLALVVILASIRIGSIAPFLLASLVAGAAQGATFAGSLRSLLAETRPAERAGPLAVVYAISYCGAAIPALIAGQLARTLSLFHIALGYGALAAIACAVTSQPRRTPTANERGEHLWKRVRALAGEGTLREHERGKRVHARSLVLWRLSWCAGLSWTL
jgi:MFS family permease